MDRNKMNVKRGPKIKPLPPPGDFIVLGAKNAKPSVESLDLKLGVGQSSSSSSSSSTSGAKGGSNGDRKRDASGRGSSPTPLGGPLAKKPKLASSSPSSLSGEVKREKGGQARGDTWDTVALEVDSTNLIGQIMAAEEKLDDERCERLLCGAVKLMKANRAKPDPPVYLGLMFLAKTKPTLFCSDHVTEGFCSLLKRDPAVGFKSKGNSLVSVLACNVLLSAYQEDINWPDSFVRMYMDDALGERVWVDRVDCKGFVDNILTAFSTKPSPKGLLLPELNFKSDVASSPPTSSIDADDDLFETMQSLEGGDSSDVPAFPRYTRSSETVEKFVLETMRDQVSRRQPMDNVSRNVLKVLASTAGLPEIRLLVAQKLEMWMQNPKLTRPAQDILLAVCINCNRHDQQDIEVISHLLKIRLKTKPVINHYLQCIRELLGQHSDNSGTVLQHIIYNELSTSRNPNNMALLTVLFQHSPERAARLLAETFREVLDNRDDYLRAVRVLFREIVRSLRHDLNFAAFCLGLMRERKESETREPEQALRDRLLLSVADLITLAIFLSIAPAVRESAAANARGDRRELGVLRAFQRQITEIQRDAVWWLHTSVARLRPGKVEFVHCLQKVLFMEQPEHYYNKDNWPAESERAIMMRLASEVPVAEDTLIRILVMGLSKDHPIGAAEALDLADQLVKRAAQLHADDLQVMEVQRLELFDAVFNLCAYHHPENIALPPGYRAPELAISALYWKAWITLLIVTAHNPATFGLAAWENYPTLRCFMEMCITNHFAFPPPTMGERAEEMRAKEAQICQLERQDIVEFENHLAAASMHVVITESNSLLLAQLTSIDPGGACRRPPAHVLEQLESLNRLLKLGHLLCRTRNPDFLLDIIQCQGTSQYMPWLAELVESSEGALDVLPVQCLCEFLLTDGWSEEFQRPTPVSDGDREETKAEKAERIRRREKRHKQRQLQRHLRNIVSGSSPDPQPTREVLDYFLGRLGSQQMMARRQAVRGLVLVLVPPAQDDDDEEELERRPVASIRLDGESTDEECSWLLRYLPSLHHFESVRATASVALRRACKVESDPVMVSAYIRFLAEYAPCDQPSDLGDLAFDVAHMIIERTTIVNYLLPALGEGGSGGNESAVMSALVAIFVQYLRKAREPSGAEYSWSEAQDHVLIQWSTGEVATMQIFVVHAMIVLLVYGPTSDSLLFDELLEAWFPANAAPPQAFLVDTSEEALLFPDWLKLRMMRSNVEELVDAALRDLEPSQLVLFIQSFGIPVRSVAKLLRALDSAVECNSYLVEQAVVDKGYMAKFVRVQQQRGASGGELFARFLASDPSDGDEDSATEDVEEQERRRPRPLAPAPLVVPPPLPQQTIIALQDVTSRLIGLFDLDPTGSRCGRVEDRDTLRCLQKRLALEARSSSLDKPYTQQVISFLAISLHPTDGHFLIRRLLTKHVAAGPLFRLLLSSCCRPGIIVNPSASKMREICQSIVTFAAAADISTSPLLVIIRANPFVAQALQSRAPASATTAYAPLGSIGKMDDEAVERVVRETVERQPARLERVTRRLVRMAMEADQSVKIVTAFTRILVNDLQPSTKSSAHPANGLLVDWLELLETEVIGSGDPTRGDMQRRLLFGRRLQPGSGGVGSGQAACRPYLLATLTHRASWVTLRNCVRLLLGPENSAKSDVEDRPYAYDATAVLDFLHACMHIPKLWQGRDKHIPKHSVVEDILAPTKMQVVRMAGHVLEEAHSLIPNEQLEGDTAHDPIERRLSLLLHCCNDRRNVVKGLATYLLDKAGSGGPLSRVAHRLLIHAYLQVPRLVRFLPDPSILFSDNAVALRTPSRLDPVSHTLLSALASLDVVKDWKDKLRDVDLACRKLASAHPLLVLRQLPMVATSLRGRAHFDYSVFRARHHLAFFVSVAGLLELLQPHIYRPEYAIAFEDVCGSYLDLIRAHGFHSKELAGLISRFLNLLVEYMAFDARRALPLAQKHAPVLHDLLDLFPEHPALRAITTALSLPRQLPLFDGDSGVTSTAAEEPSAVLHSFAPPQQVPAWNPAHLQPIAARFQNLDNVEDVLVALHDLDNFSSRKVAVLEFFSDDIKRLLSHPSENCRNLSYNLLMKLLKCKPDLAKDFLDTYLNCYESDYHDVVISALERLSEFVLLCQEHANLILQKTFKLNLTTNINTVPYIGEIIMLLNMQSGS